MRLSTVRFNKYTQNVQPIRPHAITICRRTLTAALEPSLDCRRAHCHSSSSPAAVTDADAQDVRACPARAIDLAGDGATAMVDLEMVRRAATESTAD